MATVEHGAGCVSPLAVLQLWRFVMQQLTVTQAASPGLPASRDQGQSQILLAAQNFTWAEHFLDSARKTCCFPAGR